MDTKIDIKPGLAAACATGMKGLGRATDVPNIPGFGKLREGGLDQFCGSAF